MQVANLSMVNVAMVNLPMLFFAMDDYPTVNALVEITHQQILLQQQT